MGLQRQVVTRSRLLQQSPSTAHPSRRVYCRHMATSAAGQTLRPATRVHRRTLSMLPLSTVLRSYMIMSISSSPFVMSVMTSVLARILRAKSRLFDVDRNLVLRWLFKKTFYAQFCMGEDVREVEANLRKLREIGYDGVILEYAAESLEEEEIDGVDDAAGASSLAIGKWRSGLLETIGMTDEDNFVAFKWSGMGNEAIRRMKANQPPSAEMLEAMRTVCDAAFARRIALLPAAEMQNAQAAADAWTLLMAHDYNKRVPEYAMLYNTYQCYLKSTPTTLQKHLDEAAEGGFTLGVKLVRGAYLQSERRDLIWATKRETDECYDSITERLLDAQPEPHAAQQSSGSTSAGKARPSINLMIASHNLQSVRKARAQRDAQMAQHKKMVPLYYAQLFGMADEISCELLAAGQVPADASKALVERPKVFKYVGWGTTSECLGYLMRRATENKEAMARTVDTKRAMAKELWQRMSGGEAT